MPDIATQIKTNEENAFSFLAKSENILPDNMRGYTVDLSVDMNFDDTSEEALKKSAKEVEFFAKQEGLTAHAKSAVIRLKDYE